MIEGRYTLVFKKLEEATAEEATSDISRAEIMNIQTEAEEIAELRRIVMEISTPQPICFAGT